MEYLKTYLDCPVKIDSIYTVHYFEYSKNYIYKGESHDFWEFVYADKGDVIITAGKQEIVLKHLLLFLENILINIGVEMFYINLLLYL